MSIFILRKYKQAIKSNYFLSGNFEDEEIVCIFPSLNNSYLFIHVNYFKDINKGISKTN